MDSQTENGLREELNYLYSKKSSYGWTEKDVQRVEYLERILGIS